MGLDNDAIVLLLDMTHQLVVSIHYSTSVSTRDKLRIAQVLSKRTKDNLVMYTMTHQC